MATAEEKKIAADEKRIAADKKRLAVDDKKTAKDKKKLEVDEVKLEADQPTITGKALIESIRSGAFWLSLNKDNGMTNNWLVAEFILKSVEAQRLLKAYDAVTTNGAAAIMSNAFMAKNELAYAIWEAFGFDATTNWEIADTIIDYPRWKNEILELFVI